MNFSQEIGNSVLSETRISQCPSFQLSNWSLSDPNGSKNIQDDSYNESRAIAATMYQLNRLQSKRNVAGFISKLYECLQSPEINQQHVRWCKYDGKDMFYIENIRDFTSVILSRLFKHCKLPSFVRQLNIYGFRRDTDARKSKNNTNRDSCRWYHPLFKPGSHDLLYFIRRKFGHVVQRRNLLDEENLDITLSLDMSKPLHEEIESRRRNSYHSLPFLTNNLGQVIFDKQLGSKPIYKYPNESAPSTQGAHLFYTSNERLKGADSSSQILDIPQDISTKKEFEYMVQKYEQMKVSLQETLKAANQRIEKQDVYIERLENLIKKLSFTDLQKNPHSYVPQNTAEYKHCFPSTPGSSISSECTTDNSEHFSSMQDKHLGSSLDINYQLQPGSSSGNSFWN